MSEVVCIADNLHPENPFSWVCDYLTKTFQTEVIDVSNATKEHVNASSPRIIISNHPNCLYYTAVPVVFYMTNEQCLDNAVRRQIKVGRTEVFAASMSIAKKVYDCCRIKPRIQYPCLPETEEQSFDYILYDAPEDLIGELYNELPQENFAPYYYASDFASAKLYIHSGEHGEWRGLISQAYGISSVYIRNQYEFACSGDTLLPAGTNIKQIVQGVKLAMRDRNQKEDLVRESRKHYNNLDALVDKVKREASKHLPQPQPIKPPLTQAKISERAQQIIARRRHQPAPTPTRSVPTVLPVFKGFQRTEYVIPTSYLLPTPEWFKTLGEIDVSVVVPMFNSATVIQQQIRNWDTMSDGIRKEIIYVNDSCPQNSAEHVLYSWENKRTKELVANSILPEKFYRVGKVVLLSHNSGFATACNFGAKHAIGKYLLFLNADCIVTPNWIRPMYDLMQSDDNIGVVGNMQLKQDGSIDSAGSEWMWDSKTFDHIGRNVYHGKRLSKMMHFGAAPEDLLVAGEREMVTGCCFMIKKDLFDEIGFNVGYRIGYWEDSELNMEVRNKGYKVYFTPDSIVYHRTEHAGAGGHPYVFENARLFYERWVNNGKINSLVKAKK